MDLMRIIDPATQAQLSAAAFHPVILVWLDWPGGVVRVHSGTGTITWGGYSWAGVGKFGQIQIPEESTSGVPVEMALSLICDLPELAAYADAVIRRRAGQAWMGVTTQAGGNELIGAPVEMAAGLMDTLVLSVEVSEGNGSTTVAYQLTVGLTTGPGYRSAAAIAHSHEDQIRSYPADTAGKKLVLASARAAKTLWPAP